MSAALDPAMPPGAGPPIPTPVAGHWSHGVAPPPALGGGAAWWPPGGAAEPLAQSPSPGRALDASLATLDAERRRGEVAALREEVAALLRMNGQLQAQLNFHSARSAAASAMASPSRCGAGAAPTPGWEEERGLLEERAASLAEECRELENDRSLRRSLASSAGEPSALAALVRERDDLQQRLRAAELAREAAEGRLQTAESAWTRTMEELESRRRQASQMGQINPWIDSEVDRLRRELGDAKAGLEETDRAIARKREQAMASERDRDAAKSEHGALLEANDSLRRDVEGLKSKVEVEQRRTKSAEAEVADLRNELRLKEMDFGTKVGSVRSKAQLFEEEVTRTMAALEQSEASAARDRIGTLEVKAELETFVAAHDELKAQHERACAERQQEGARLHARAEQLSAEKAELGQRLADVHAAAARTREQEEEQLRRCQAAERSVNDERALEEDRCARSMAEVRSAEQRLEFLASQLAEERRKSSELAREVAVAAEAASDAGRPPWAHGFDRRRTERQAEWGARSADVHRELDLLQKWRGDAEGVLHRLQSDMASVQGQYRQQLEYNQELQQKLLRMGQQARAAVSASPPPEPRPARAAGSGFSAPAPFGSPSGASPRGWPASAATPLAAAGVGAGAGADLAAAWPGTGGWPATSPSAAPPPRWSAPAASSASSAPAATPGWLPPAGASEPSAPMGGGHYAPASASAPPRWSPPPRSPAEASGPDAVCGASWPQCGLGGGWSAPASSSTAAAGRCCAPPAAAGGSPPAPGRAPPLCATDPLAVDGAAWQSGPGGLWAPCSPAKGSGALRCSADLTGPSTSARGAWSSAGQDFSSSIESLISRGVLVGPDVPERPDVHVGPRAVELLQSGASCGASCGAGAASGDGSPPGGGAGFGGEYGGGPAPCSRAGGREWRESGAALLSGGPVGGPFYDAYRGWSEPHPQQAASARLAAGSPSSGSAPRRRRRSGTPLSRSSSGPSLVGRPAPSNSCRAGCGLWRR